jgi:predicted alpha/beta-hydrolase family hydrolase
MEHPFMSLVAGLFADAGIASLRYQFPYMEQGSKRPDRPQVAHAAVRAAVEVASGLLPGVPLFAGGKSFGGRMTSQAQAAQALPGVVGLIFLGFPLHESGKPASDRAKHLTDVAVPMLFVQGTRDKLAEIDRIRALAESLPKTAHLLEIEEADHSFHVPKRSGHTDEDAISAVVSGTLAWVQSVIASD